MSSSMRSYSRPWIWTQLQPNILPVIVRSRSIVAVALLRKVLGADRSALHVRLANTQRLDQRWLCCWLWRCWPRTHHIRIQTTPLPCVAPLQPEWAAAIDRTVIAYIRSSGNLQAGCRDIGRDLGKLVIPGVVVHRRVIRGSRLWPRRCDPACMRNRCAHRSHTAYLSAAGSGVERSVQRAEVLFRYRWWRWRSWYKIPDNGTLFAPFPKPEVCEYSDCDQSNRHRDHRKPGYRCRRKTVPLLWRRSRLGCRCRHCRINVRHGVRCRRYSELLRGGYCGLLYTQRWQGRLCRRQPRRIRVLELRNNICCRV